MLIKTYGAAVQGIDAIVVTIEAVAEPGVSFNLVGMADTAVKESYQRVISALTQSGYKWPRRRMVVNLSPADVRKEGAAYDLPIAIGVLASCEQITPSVPLESFMIMGELSLDGSLLPIKGVLPMAIKARELGFKGMIVPVANVTEGAVVNNLEVYGMSSLREVVDFITGRSEAEPVSVNTREEFARASSVFDCDFSEVKGQEGVKRAFEVACAGGHNILMVGPPGAGKSMMAKRIPTILPPLTLAEALETTKIHSVAGKLKSGSRLMTQRPYRSPHHTISPVALVGGGSNPAPGEISLAHNGVLFLDEFPEFSRQVLEVMRQPLEDRHITIARAKYTIDYPAGFMLVASMNPCPCGFYNHPTKECLCSGAAVQKYLNRISGPLLDRIDLQVEIFPVPFEELASAREGEKSEAIKRRVICAREIQALRFAAERGIHSNAQMNSRLLRTYASIDSDSLETLREAMTRLDMSARAYDRILKVARTIADLEQATAILSAGGCAPTAETLREAITAPIRTHHLSEALSYRNLDRGNWGQTVSKLPF
ncbi:ATP-binding protein [Muribaculaceae bacterium Isolate-039 (Harlan)]|jgi:magnesium chelatase family protein|uniref:YifB family Mg chelatase-like AAA ATPase n=1 Tax=Duncaniella muris TaxID=2094150 RepID=UPI000F4A46D2|nr:YifB family Mg chelatase-like AAA ATPase [Duncaniella muris]ROS90644.1 ATP-binding protein [Muribaculaceae bacterium Isolate-039 (Harlan)]ROS96334.1 ATP-binding protein [Muribaculaceae bacterium Isolate-083 (Janvier)]ROS96670.1 ATP-binding protein [Muribaculaceae bacterium Isolate-077 (Janvier)]ROT00570.1 ATP-binding protein [Muribaculaceae bacterium Isolate-084 (Janvier)]